MKSIKSCPSCGSADVTLWMGGSLGVQYQCKKCGYHGPLVVEENPEENTLFKTYSHV